MMIKRGERCYLDSNALVAIFERKQPATMGQQQFLASVARGGVWCTTSELAVAEVLVMPFRNNDDILTDLYIDFIDNHLSDTPLLIDRIAFISAARLRAVSKMKLPDAVHVACAQLAKCSVFLSADTGIRLPKSMRRLSFDDIEMEPG